MTKVGSMKLGKYDVNVFIEDGLYSYDLYSDGNFITNDIDIKTVADMFDSILLEMRKNDK